MDGNDVFGFLLILATIAILAWVGNKMEEEQRKARGQSVGPKQCPPHKWQWHEQAGGGWYIQCDTCRQYPTVSTRDDGQK